LKSLTIYWIDTKLEIQKYLADIFYKFKKFRATTQGDKDKSEIKERITFEFLNQQFQNTVVQAIQGQQEYLRQFDKVTKPIEDEIKKHNFKRAKNRLKATENNIYSIIENNNREISNFYNEIEDLNMPISSANDIREELQNWNDIKDKVLNRIRNFKNQILEEILYQEVKEFLSYMNPIPLESLAKYLNYDMGELKDKLFKFIKEQKIQAKIQDSNLIQPEKPMEEKILSIFRKVEIIGSKLSFSIRIYNPTKYFIKDLELTFIYPEILELIPDLSDSLRISIREFEPEASRIINWNFKILKDIEKKYDVQKFLMNLSYKNPFNRRIDNQKEMEMII